MTFHTWLTLGRVSNLPSIWSNVLAAVLVANASLLNSGAISHVMPAGTQWLGCLTALSLIYLGGMFLNDAFDAHWDKEHNNPRPITKGEVSALMVWVFGFALLLAGLSLVGGFYQQLHPYSLLTGWFAGAALALLILTYNRYHKSFRHSAVLMGGCRFGVYLIAALLLSEVNHLLLFAALSLWLYICGVTYVARDEHRNRLNTYWPLLLLFTPLIASAFIGYSVFIYWVLAVVFCGYLIHNLRTHLFSDAKNIRAFIGSTLAAIPLLDALWLASLNLVIPSLLCVLTFFGIQRLQKGIQAS